MEIRHKKQAVGLKFILISAIWVSLTLLFYNGSFEMVAKDHLEVSMILAFAVISLGVHILLLLKKEIEKINC